MKRNLGFKTGGWIYHNHHYLIRALNKEKSYGISNSCQLD